MALRSRFGDVLMTSIIAAALMGILFIPASAPAPATAPTTVATNAADDEPSPSPAVAKAPAAPKVALNKEALTTDGILVKLTSYNAVPEQTDGDPSVTASGAASNAEVIAARSHDLAADLPFGTVIAIYGPGRDTNNCHFSAVKHLIGYRVVADTMSKRFSKRIDVEFNREDTVSIHGVEMNPSKALGICTGVTVKVVGHIALSRIPDTQEELAQLFAPKELALNR